MAARLPVPGSDSGSWGQVLNDFLKESHNDDGTIKDVVVQTKARVAKYAQAGQLSGFQASWNPSVWDGGAGDVDVLMIDPVIGDPAPWQANTYYAPTSIDASQYNSMILEDGVAWACYAMNGVTGDTEPTEFTLGIGPDGSVAYNDTQWLLNGDGLWMASTSVSYSYVIANGYVWRAYSGTTDVTEPDWTSGDSITDNDVTWEKQGQVVDWEPNLLIGPDMTASSYPWPYVRFPGMSDRVFRSQMTNQSPRSGATKPVFDSNNMATLDNEVGWFNLGAPDYAVMPYLLGLDASKAVDGRRVTLHFNGSAYSLLSGSSGFGSGYGSGLNYGSGMSPVGSKTYSLVVGVPYAGQTIKPGQIEGTVIYATGSIELMYDAPAQVWRIIGGGNEFFLNMV